MATHSSIFAWRIPWTEEPAGLQSMGVAQSGTRLSDWLVGWFPTVIPSASLHFLLSRLLSPLPYEKGG